MFKNLHLKIFALAAAAIFWIFVVSLENTFYQFPGEVPIQVFNQAQELALSSKLGTVRLAIRTGNPVITSTLGTADFEAYVDLRNVGVGTRAVPVLVTSKNPQVSVLRVEPSEVEVTLEPVREKILSLSQEIYGKPQKGFHLDSVKLSRDSITVSGAESILKKVGAVKAEVRLDGTERDSMIKTVTVKVYDKSGGLLEGLQTDQTDIFAMLQIVELTTTKEVGVKIRFIGSLSNGVVEKIEVSPAVISVTGSRNILKTLDVIETEPIDFKEVTESFEKTVHVVIPEEISLAEGEKNVVKVKVGIEKSNVP